MKILSAPLLQQILKFPQQKKTHFFVFLTENVFFKLFKPGVHFIELNHGKNEKNNVVNKIFQIQYKMKSNLI